MTILQEQHWIQKLLFSNNNVLLIRRDFRRKGFTLVELIIVAVIVVFVLAAAFTMLRFSIASSTKINERAKIDSEFRFVMDFYEKQLSTALSVEIIESVDTDVQVGFINISMDGINGEIIERIADDTDHVALHINVSGLRVAFRTKGTDPTKIIEIMLQDGSGYQLKKEVFMQNLSLPIMSQNDFEVLRIKPVD